MRGLIASGVRVDAADGSKRTSLLSAVATHRLEAPRLLIEAGADINAQAVNMDTPWLLAARWGAPRCCGRCS